MKKLIFFLISHISINVYSQSGNLIPNSSFEVGQDGKIPGCWEYYSGDVNHNCKFNEDIYLWNIAKLNPGCWCDGIFASCPSPDWEDITCDDNVGNYAINPPSQRLVRIGGLNDEGIRVGLIGDDGNTYTLKKNKTYTLRVKLCMYGNNGINKLRIHTAKYGEHWNQDGSGNVKQSDIGYIEMSDALYASKTFYSFQIMLKPVDEDKDNEMGNIIFITELGDFLIDDVELYERSCEESLFIENTAYVIKEAPFEASPFIVAGYEIGNPPYGSGNVIVKNGADVTYKAEQEIILEPGFEVEYGGEFLALIAPCCPYMPEVNAGADAEVCDGSTHQLGITGDYSSQYSWTADPAAAISFLSSTNISNPIFTPPASGCGTVIYTLTVKSVCDITGTDKIIIKYGNNVSTPSVTATITSGVDDCYLAMNIGGINNCTNIVFIEIWNWSITSKLYSYELNYIQDFSWIMPDHITKCDNYKVKIYSQSICNSQLSSVVVLDWIRNSVISIVEAPNFFSPNNDTHNDQFCFIVNGAESYSIYITQPGISVAYHSATGNVCGTTICVWDGYADQTGLLSPDGAYYYVATFDNACQNEVSISGWVYLITSSSSKIISDTIDQNNESISSISGIDQNKKTNSDIYFNLFPNPSDGNFTIYYNINENEIMKIYDVLGREVVNYSLYKGKNTLEISGSDICKGIYYYSVSDGNKIIISDKIVIIK